MGCSLALPALNTIWNDSQRAHQPLKFFKSLREIPPNPVIFAHGEGRHASSSPIITTPKTTIMNSRRHFLRKLAISATAPAMLGGRLLAQETPPPVKLDEADPVAVALGYKMDTTKVDAQKYPQHKAEQKCSGCALVTPGAPAGEFLPCTAFQGKLVATNGWCMAFVKKPEAPAAPPAEAPKS
jgi:hypothetical protein